MTLRTLLDNYSMAQLALISHISVLKYEDEESRSRQEAKQPGRRILNPNDRGNTQAYTLIASGILS
jgi:predicted nucleotidyltransferase